MPQGATGSPGGSVLLLVWWCQPLWGLGPGVVHSGMTQAKEGYLRLGLPELAHWTKLSLAKAWPGKGDL